MNGLMTALQVALSAGAAVLEVYRRDFVVEFKDDHSPLTEADRTAHGIICAALAVTGLPVLSEESSAVPYEEREKWSRFWLVDPLDGTKEFIKKNGEFTVNIALIDAGRPVLGVVYAPVLKTFYIGVQGVGAFRATGDGIFQCLELTPAASFQALEKFEHLPLSSDLCPPSSAIRVVASRSHMTPATGAFIATMEKQGRVELVSRGSSLKLCMVADGSADVYPRIAPTMEWDTAAAQAVVEAAGGRVLEYDPAIPAIQYLRGGFAGLKDLRYNKKNLMNPFFVTTGSQIMEGK